MKKLSIFAVALLVSGQAILAQVAPPPDTLPTADLQPVTVTAFRMEGTDLTTPLAMTNVGSSRLQRGQQQLALDEALSAVPGVFVQNGSNFAQDIRVSIRGFGARSAFGIRGVKVMVDGFPESSPDGQAQVDAIDPGTLSSLQVLRSSSAGIYGNASGGVISFNTLDFNGLRFFEAGATVGSFGFEKYQLRTVQGKPGRARWAANGSYTATNGFREHSAMKNYLLNGGVFVPLDSSCHLVFTLSYVNSPLAQDPGGLTLEGVRLDRRAANAPNLQFDADESLWQLRAGALLEKRFKNQQKLRARAYHTQRQFENRLPTFAGGAVAFDRAFSGLNLQHQLSKKLRGMPWEIAYGLDLETQSDDRSRFNNLDGRATDKVFDQTESFSTAGLFLVQKLAPSQRVSILPSLRYDRIFLSVDDHFLADLDDSGDRDFHAFSFTLGLNYALNDLSSVYLTGGSNYETPTLTELANPSGGGGFNPDLGPQRSKFAELGFKQMAANGRLRHDAAVFLIGLEDELVPFTNAGGRVFYRNQARSGRVGLEYGLTAYLGSHFFGHFHYTYSHFKYRSGSGFDGNWTPGQPRSVGGFELRRSPADGLHLMAGLQYADAFFVNDANTDETRPYLLANMRAGFVKKREKWQFEPFVGINNLFNASYYSNFRMNAALNKFYEPAPGIHYFAGVKVRVF